MTKWLPICLCLLTPMQAQAQAQPAVVVPGEIYCPDCAASGQKPAPPGFDASQIEFVPGVIPVFMNGQTLRIKVVARVVHAAPLVFETLDSTFQLLDRAMKVVRDDRGIATDPSTCGGPMRMQVVDLASKPVVSTLQLNDIVTGTVVLNRSEKRPDSPLDGTMVLTSVRKASAPTRLFHTAPFPDQFVDPRLRSAGDAPAAWRQPVPDDFLAKLPAANPPDLAGNDSNRLVYFSQSGRMYRVVKPLYCKPSGNCTFANLDAAEVAEPAKGECVLGTPNCQTTVYPDGRRVHLAADPYLTAASGRFWPRDMGVRLRDLAPGGTVISREEYEKHKAIYFPILRFRMLGSNYIEDGILYPQVRVCQLEQGAADACAVRVSPSAGQPPGR